MRRSAFSRRCFSPAEEEGTLTQRTNTNDEKPESAVEKSIHLNVSNETMQGVDAVVRWALRNALGEILVQGEETAHVPALSAHWFEKHVFPQADLYGDYASYELYLGGAPVSSGAVLFCAPKHFRFEDPQLSVRVAGDELIVSARAYARSVEIVCDDGDVLFDDNYFDLNAGEKRVRILRGEGTKFRARSVYDIR